MSQSPSSLPAEEKQFLFTVIQSGGSMFEGLAQPMHLVMILFIALLFFGPSKLAGLGKGMGEGIRGFKDALRQAPGQPDQPDSAAKEQ